MWEEQEALFIVRLVPLHSALTARSNETQYSAFVTIPLEIVTFVLLDCYSYDVILIERGVSWFLNSA